MSWDKPPCVYAIDQRMIDKHLEQSILFNAQNDKFVKCETPNRLPTPLKINLIGCEFSDLLTISSVTVWNLVSTKFS